MRWSVVFAAITCAAAAGVFGPNIVLAAEPASVDAPQFQPGDTWTYDRTHEAGKTHFSQERAIETIERVGSDNLLLGVKLDGSPNDFDDHLVGLDLSERRTVNGESTVTERLLSFPMKIGSTWQEDFVDPRQQGAQTSARVQKTYKVIGWEDVTVPAGTFHALKIEANGKLIAQVSLPATAISSAMATTSGATSISHAERARSGTITNASYRVLYYAPEIKSYVKSVYEQYDTENVRTKRDISVLVSFKPGH